MKKYLTEEECYEILDKADYGTLALSQGERPYLIPMNYTVIDGEIYLHTAMKGRKVEILKENKRVAFSIVISHKLVEEKFTFNFTSLLYEGLAQIVENKNEKVKVLEALVKKHSKNFLQEAKKVIERSCDHTLIIRLKKEKLTGRLSKMD